MPKILFFPSTSQDPAQWLHPRGCPWGGGMGTLPAPRCPCPWPELRAGTRPGYSAICTADRSCLLPAEATSPAIVRRPWDTASGFFVVVGFYFFFPSPPCSSSELAVWVVAAARGAVQRSWHGGSAVARPGCLGCSAAVGERRRPAGTAVARSGSGASSCAGGGCAVGRRRAWSPAAGCVPSVSGRGTACPPLAVLAFGCAKRLVGMADSAPLGPGPGKSFSRHAGKWHWPVEAAGCVRHRAVGTWWCGGG